MSKPLRIGRASFLALLAALSSSVALSDTPAQTRVTIRGTGTNVKIEGAETPAARRFRRKSAAPSGVLVDATALKSSGADDSTVIAYLRAHQAGLPPVIDSAAVERLRKAGAGKSVVAYLATVAAVDIGPTGEGHGPSPSYAPYEAPVPEEPIYDMSYGYPGGYAAIYPAFPSRFHAHRFRFRRMPRPTGRPIFHRPFMSGGRLMPGGRRFSSTPRPAMP